MSKQKFQVGDKVIALKGRLFKGKTGTITEYVHSAWLSHGFYRVFFDDDCKADFYSYDLKKADETVQHKFKVGDKVVLTKKAIEQAEKAKNPELTIYGKVWEISCVHENLPKWLSKYEGGIELKGIDNLIFYSEDLVAASDEMPTKFKVGDRVRCINKNLCYYNEVCKVLSVGTIVTIVALPDGLYPAVRNEDLVKIEDDMNDKNNERTVKLTLEKAREWYKVGGELKEVALQAYTERELIDKPRSWEEFCKNYEMTGYEYYIDEGANIRSVGPCWNVMQNPQESRNILPSKEYAEAFLALMQLINLRNAWVGDWKPDSSWNTANSWMFAYRPRNNDWITENHCWTQGKALTFPTQEMTEDFLSTFKDLIEQAKILF